jgi:YgiT-type zinc finger domain-containing protein
VTGWNIEEAMKLFEKCPMCGGELAEKKVDKILMGGSNTAVVTVLAEVCLHCGERLYSMEVISRFDEIRKKLREDNVEKFIPIGKTFKVA